MKAFIIRLSDNELSTSLAKESYQAAEELGYDVEYYEGVSDKKEIMKEYMKDHIILNNEGSDISKNWGTQGCAISHYKLWKLCAELQEPIVILEHDGVPIRTCDDLVEQVEDVCHLDRFLPFTTVKDKDEYSEYYNKAVYECEDEGTETYPELGFFYGKKEDYTGNHFRGAYGYLLMPSGAEKLVSFCKENGLFPADKTICEKAVNIQRVNSTRVRLNPFFKTVDVQREYTTRV